MSTSATTSDQPNALLTVDGDEAGLASFDNEAPPTDRPSRNGSSKGKPARKRRRRQPSTDGDGKLAAEMIDAVPVAAEYLATTEIDGIPRLRFWRGTFWEWREAAYRPLPLSAVQGRLVESLDCAYCHLTKTAVGNVLMALQAKAGLSHDIAPPTWIEEPAPWPATEVMAATNGLFHLPSLIRREDCLIEPTPRFFNTAALNYAFSIEAPRPDTWLRFLGQLWPDDGESIATLQEWYGLCLTPDTRHHKIAMLIGPPRSGKGTLCRVLTALLGRENVAGPTLASLATNFGLWPLIGKILAIISDARLGGRTDSQIVVERLLSISGEDALTIDRKNMEPMTVRLPTRLMVCSNELPRLGDASGALANRMILLRLTQSFLGREDHHLTDRLLTELPGILLWAIEGWRRLWERGRFIQPTAADELLGELQDLSSPVGAFIRQCCNVGPEYETSRGALYGAYSEWAKGHGRDRIEDEIGFGRSLRAALPSVVTRQHRISGQPVRHYGGVGLRD